METVQKTNMKHLPVGVVNKNGTKVSDNVDHAKHEAVTRKHGQVRPLVVSRNRTASVLARFKERFVGLGVHENGFTLLGSVRDSLIQKGIDLVGRIVLDVYSENHGDQNSKDNGRVKITGQVNSLETTRYSVQNDSPGDQKGG
jgi:hypothetical protein